MVYHYTGATDSPRYQLCAWQLRPGMFVMFEGRWVLVGGYNQEANTLTIINARKGGLVEEKVLHPNFLVTVRKES